MEIIGKIDEALEYFTEFKRLSPSNTKAYDHMSEFFLIIKINSSDIFVHMAHQTHYNKPKIFQL